MCKDPATMQEDLLRLEVARIYVALSVMQQLIYSDLVLTHRDVPFSPELRLRWPIQSPIAPRDKDA